MRGQKLTLRHAQHRVAEQMAAEGEHHDEAPDALPGARPWIAPAAQVAVVELRLMPRRGIVAKHRGALGGTLFGELGAHIATQAGDAHGEAMLVTQALVDGGQRGGRYVLLDVVVEGLDLAVHRGARTRICELGEPLAYPRCPLCRRERRASGNHAGRLGAAGVLAHGLAVEAQGAGHLGDVVSRIPVSEQLHHVHHREHPPGHPCPSHRPCRWEAIYVRGP